MTAPFYFEPVRELCDRVNSAIEDLANRRAKLIDEWVRGVLAKVLPAETMAGPAEGIVDAVHAAGIRLIIPQAANADGTETELHVFQGSDEIAACRFRVCFGEDAFIPTPL